YTPHRAPPVRLLSLHDALPILLDHLGIRRAALVAQSMGGWAAAGAAVRAPERLWAVVMANTVGNLTNPDIAALRQKLAAASPPRSEEHTSELQSRFDLVCRLLL